MPLLLCVVLLRGAAGVAAEPEAIDWMRARDLYRRSQQGEKLSAEDQAYLERAKAARANGAQGAPGAAAANPDFQRARQLKQKLDKGEALTEDEQSFLRQMRQRFAAGGGAEAARPAAPPPRDSTGLVPLDQMTSADKYKGVDGGLYGSGQNKPPRAHLAAALAASKKMVPLDAEGKPSARGKIVLLSMGMSNTTMEYSRFKQLADADPEKSPVVVIVDGAQGGQDAERWNHADANAWKVVGERLAAAGVTSNQVQGVWLKQARMAPARFGEFPKHTEELEGQILGSLQLARQRFPNLRIAWLSSRIYAGYATTGLNPEPYAYEGAFAVRELILRQVKGDAALNWDPAKGGVKTPLLLWGPYLWGDGLTPRKSDGLVWKREDLSDRDGTHPSPASGREKVGRLLLEFFKTDPVARLWFVK